MSLYNAAQAMVEAQKDAKLLFDQLDDLMAGAALWRSTYRMKKELHAREGQALEQAIEIDEMATEIVDGIRALKTKTLEVSGKIERLGEPPAKGES